MNREQPPPPYNPYYPPHYPNATQGNIGQPTAGMMPPAGQPTAGMMPPVGQPTAGMMPPVGQPTAGMMPPVGQPTAGMMPPVVEHVNMGIPDSAPPEYSLGFEDENCFSDATIRRGQLCSLELTNHLVLLLQKYHLNIFTNYIYV